MGKCAHFCSCLEGRGILVSSLKKPQTLTGSTPAKGPSTAAILCFLAGLSVSARVAEAVFRLCCLGELAVAHGMKDDAGNA